MTIHQAVELVRIFWPKEKLEEYHHKIMGNYPEKKWFLMMIGSPRGINHGNNKLERLPT